MSRQEVLKILRRETPKVRTRFGVKRLALFGSVARDEARPDSDVDVLVEFDGPVTLDRYMGLKFQLEDALGARVDLVTTTGLKPRVRPVVEREAIDVA
jgi:predicted nucleotidyltransferase